MTTNLIVDTHAHINPPNLPNYNAQFEPQKGFKGFLYVNKNDGCGCGATIYNPDDTLFRKIQDNCFDPTLMPGPETQASVQAPCKLPTNRTYANHLHLALVS